MPRGQRKDGQPIDHDKDGIVREAELRKQNRAQAKGAEDDEPSVSRTVRRIGEAVARGVQRLAGTRPQQPKDEVVDQVGGFAPREPVNPRDAEEDPRHRGAIRLPNQMEPERPAQPPRRPTRARPSRLTPQGAKTGGQSAKKMASNIGKKLNRGK